MSNLVVRPISWPRTRPVDVDAWWAKVPERVRRRVRRARVDARVRARRSSTRAGVDAECVMTEAERSQLEASDRRRVACRERDLVPWADALAQVDAWWGPHLGAAAAADGPGSDNVHCVTLNSHESRELRVACLVTPTRGTVSVSSPHGA